MLLFCGIWRGCTFCIWVMRSSNKLLWGSLLNRNVPKLSLIAHTINPQFGSHKCSIFNASRTLSQTHFHPFKKKSYILVGLTDIRFRHSVSVKFPSLYRISLFCNQILQCGKCLLSVCPFLKGHLAVQQVVMDYLCISLSAQANACSSLTLTFRTKNTLIVSHTALRLLALETHFEVCWSLCSFLRICTCLHAVNWVWRVPWSLCLFANCKM